MNPGNPQWITWLEEWEEQVTLKPNSSKYQVEAIAKAIRALKQCPVTFKDPQDAQQLKFVGPATIKYLANKERLSSPSNSQSQSRSQSQSGKEKKQRSSSATSSSRSTKNDHMRTSIILAMYKAHLRNRPVGLSYPELNEQANEIFDKIGTSSTKPSGSSISRPLLNKLATDDENIISKSDTKPILYSLTSNGMEIAKSLHVQVFNNDGDDNDKDEDEVEVEEREREQAARLLREQRIRDFAIDLDDVDELLPSPERSLPVQLPPRKYIALSLSDEDDNNNSDYNELLIIESSSHKSTPNKPKSKKFKQADQIPSILTTYSSTTVPKSNSNMDLDLDLDTDTDIELDLTDALPIRKTTNTTSYSSFTIPSVRATTTIPAKAPTSIEFDLPQPLARSKTAPSFMESSPQHTLSTTKSAYAPSIILPSIMDDADTSIKLPSPMNPAKIPPPATQPSSPSSSSSLIILDDDLTPKLLRKNTVTSIFTPISSSPAIVDANSSFDLPPPLLTRTKAAPSISTPSSTLKPTSISDSSAPLSRTKSDNSPFVMKSSSIFDLPNALDDSFSVHGKKSNNLLAEPIRRNKTSSSLVSPLSSSSSLPTAGRMPSLSSSTYPIPSLGTALNTDKVTIDPGKYAITLVLDNREIKDKNNRSGMYNALMEKGIPVEQRPLSIGDVAWIAKPCHTTGDSIEDEELVLDAIIERKRIDDLCSSLLGGRYDEQKARIKRSGMTRKFYLLEHGRSTESYLKERYSKQINTICSQLQLVDNFLLHQAYNFKEIIKYISELHSVVTDIYDGTAVQVVRDAHLNRRQLAAGIQAYRDDPSRNKMELCTTYSTFQYFNSKEHTVRVGWAEMISSVRGMSYEKTCTFIERWPTPIEYWQDLKIKLQDANNGVSQASLESWVEKETGKKDHSQRIKSALSKRWWELTSSL